MRRSLYRQKSFDFFENGQFLSVIFKSYASLLKSPGFMSRVFQNMFIADLPLTLQPITQPLLRLHNFNKTASSDQIHILHSSFFFSVSTLALHLKSNIYSCCKFVHDYQNYAKDVVSVFRFNYHIVLSYIISNAKNIYVLNFSWLQHIHLPAFVMIQIKKAGIFVIYTRSFVL